MTKKISIYFRFGKKVIYFFGISILFFVFVKKTAQKICGCAENKLTLHKILKIVQ